jgi:predicted metalloprotease with PDZ domain
MYMVPYMDNFIIIDIAKEGSLESHLIMILAHENLHNWFGGILRAPLNEYPSYAWFIEGFTTYYTDYLNSLNGIISDEEYLESYNKSLKDYFTSPFKNATNQDIASINEYSAIYDIPYSRGRIFAQELDTYIKKVTHNKYNLDLYVKLLMSLAKIDTTILFDNDFFIKTLQEVIGYDISDMFTKTILNGGDIELKTKTILGRAVILTKTETTIEDWGFDLLKTELTNIISGVKDSSDAYKKGLRNGQKFKGYDADNLKIAISVIDEKGKLKKIEFLRIEQKVMVPQYSFLRPQYPTLTPTKEIFQNN